MPILARHILADLILPLRLLHDPHIDLDHTHALDRTLPRLLAQRPHKRQHDPTHAGIAAGGLPIRPSRAARIREHDRARVLERARRQRRVEE